MPPQPGVNPGIVKQYDLSRGGYAVSVDIGKSFQTRLQAGSEMMGQVLQSSPDLMTIIGDLYFRFQDFPGSTEIADRLKASIAQQHPDFFGDENQSPEAMKAQLQGAQQQLQQMQQQLQQATQEIQTKQAEQQAKVQIAQMEEATRLRIAEMDNQTKIAVADIQAKQAQWEQAMVESRAIMREDKQAVRDAEEADKQRAHEAAMEAAQAVPPAPQAEEQPEEPQGMPV